MGLVPQEMKFLLALVSASMGFGLGSPLEPGPSDPSLSLSMTSIVYRAAGPTR